MINKLDIPINYNETRALISMVNNRKTETLNINEFIKLVYDENANLKMNLNDLECKKI